MNGTGVAIQATGLITSVGLSSPASCAAIRAKLTNPSETAFIDSSGDRIMAHQVWLGRPWRGLVKLARMAVLAIEEALADVPKDEWSAIPLLLCISEQDRPGRVDGLDKRLFEAIEQALEVRFAAASMLIPQGRVAMAVAMLHARSLLDVHHVARVLIVAADSLLTWPALSHYDRSDRLLTQRNSNGFMPGEGAGAVLVHKPSAAVQLVCTGVGLGMEAAHLDSEMPLRADGLVKAMKTALAEAGRGIHDMDFRVTDISGEQYYFKEAALAVGRLLRQRKEEFDLWHPAESIGESGALAGVALVALIDASCRKRFSKGSTAIAHMANDTGPRAALVLEYRGGL